MKPDWNDAPEWANYLAMDKDHEWHWYEDEPEIASTFWHFRRGRYAHAPLDARDNWTKSREQRPCDKAENDV